MEESDVVRKKPLIILTAWKDIKAKVLTDQRYVFLLLNFLGGYLSSYNQEWREVAEIRLVVEESELIVDEEVLQHTICAAKQGNTLACVNLAYMCRLGIKKENMNSTKCLHGLKE